MLLVLAFCSKDWELAERNLAWMKELDGHLPFRCVLSYDNETPQGAVQRCETIARSLFKETELFWYPAPVKKYWPAAPNCAWQNAARYIAAVHQDSWLFLEPDAIPIRKGWLTELADAHRKGGKPFSGSIVRDMGHFNGVAIYPTVVAQYAQDPLMVEEVAWDVVIGSVLDSSKPNNEFVNDVKHLIQHCWLMDHEKGEASNGVGVMPTFNDTHDIVKWVNLDACLFHRCKDGTIIDQLRRHYEAPHLAMVPNHVTVSNQVAQAAPENIVPLPVEPVPELVSLEQPKPSTNGTPKVEIFIVTYGLPTKRVTGLVVSDFDWLIWCLRSIRRHCTGFTGITLAIPDRDAQLLKPIAAEHANSKCGIPLRIKLVKEKPGKGFLTHAAAIGSADEFVLPDTDYVLHLDADCIAKESVTPSEYVVNEKPIYVVRSYESLIDADTKSVSDCHQWKSVAEANIGMPIEMYSMLRHPSCFPIDFYKKFRARIEEVHKKSFMDYVLSCRDGFPQTYAEFPAQGGFAYATMRERFHWIDVSGGNHLAPQDKFKVYWSHSGLNQTIQKEIESFLQ